MQLLHLLRRVCFTSASEHVNKSHNFHQILGPETSYFLQKPSRTVSCLCCCSVMQIYLILYKTAQPKKKKGRPRPHQHLTTHHAMQIPMKPLLYSYRSGKSSCRVGNLNSQLLDLTGFPSQKSNNRSASAMIISPVFRGRSNQLRIT